MGLTLHAIEDAAALAMLAPEWRALFARCPAATPFQSPEWLLPWWETFAPGDLRTLAVRRGGDLVGLAPFWRETGPRGRRLLPLGIGISDHLDMLLDPAFAQEAGLRIAEGLSDWRDWDVCAWEELDPEAAALALPAPPGTRETATDHSACPAIELPPSPARLEDVLPPAKLRKVRMARHRLARRSGVSLVEAGTDTSGFLDALIDLHGRRWRARGEEGVLGDERVRRFHGLALPLLRDAGLLRAEVLAIDGSIAAAHYGLAAHGRVYAYLGGFDPDFAHESPGTILMARAIDAALQAGARRFDLLRGREDYKYGWGARDRWNRRRSFQRV